MIKLYEHMKSKVFIKVALVVAITFICIITVFYSFMRLNTAEEKENLDIYSLVPQSATAVFETNLLSELTVNIDSMYSSKNGITLHAYGLLGLLKDCMTIGNKYIDKVLLSIHGTDANMDQILYCDLSLGGYKFAKSFISRHFSQAFTPKHSEFRGCDIIVYPVDMGRFLTVFLTKDFLVASFRKRLVEQAIDSYYDKKSLLQSPEFMKIYTNEKRSAEAILYVNMDSISIGTLGSDYISGLGGWGEFDIKFRKDAIVCSGKAYPVDSISYSLIDMKKMEEGKILPASTAIYSRWSISGQRGLQTDADNPKSVDYVCNIIEEHDEKLQKFLKDYAGDYMSFCLLIKEEAQEQIPHAVAVLPLTDERGASRYLRSWLRNASIRKRKQIPHGTCSVFVNHYKDINAEKYVVTKQLMFPQIPGVTDADSIYVCFFEGNLLVSRDKRSIYAYTDAVKDDNNGVPLRKAEEYLPAKYTFILFADMERVLSCQESYASHLLPTHFFGQHAEFFKHFILAMQVASEYEAASFNLVLLYKD